LQGSNELGCFNSDFSLKLPLANAGYTNDVDTNGTPALEGNRARVYDYVRKHPGSHLREIKKNLGIGMGDLQYQLYILEKMGLINSMRRGLYKFVFPSGIFGDKQAVILGALSLETQREILLFFVRAFGPYPA
jgi:predicted transcriptional regulator